MRVMFGKSDVRFPLTEGSGKAEKSGDVLVAGIFFLSVAIARFSATRD